MFYRTIRLFGEFSERETMNPYSDTSNWICRKRNNEFAEAEAEAGGSGSQNGICNGQERWNEKWYQGHFEPFENNKPLGIFIYPLFFFCTIFLFWILLCIKTFLLFLNEFISQYLCLHINYSF